MPHYTRVCPACGVTFTAWRSITRTPPIYCSRGCQADDKRGQPGVERSPKITVHCLQCDKPFTVTQAVIDKGHGRYCSKSCASRHTSTGRKMPPRSEEWRRRMSEAKKGNTPGNKKVPVPITCAICGKVVERIPSQAVTSKYCSRECSNEAKRRNTGPGHPLWTRVRRTCEWCGAEAWVKPAKLEEFRFCSRQCLGAYTAAQMAALKGPTSIERALSDELTRRGIAHRMQHRIAKWAVDLSIPECRIAIEADGDYWHSTEAQRAKDANKDHWLRAHKWTVLRFSEKVIHADVAGCVDRIVEAMRRQG